MRQIFSFSRAERTSAGFTLIEVMITVAIIGILAAVAIPAYSDYVTRGKIPEATSALGSMRVQMEQYYQDNRNYGSDNEKCGIATPAAGNFTYTCTEAAADDNQTYLITATGVAERGMNGFVYTINHAGNRRTTDAPAGWGAAPVECWVVKKGGAC